MFLAKLLSRLLHPIFIPTITLSIISIKFVNIIILSNQLDIIIVGVMIFTLLFPLLSILYLLYTDRIKSLQIEDRKERILPITITIIWMLIGYYFLANILDYAPIIKTIYLGMIATLFTTLLITKYWKISLHMAAIGGCFGVFLCYTIYIWRGNKLCNSNTNAFWLIRIFKGYFESSQYAANLLWILSRCIYDDSFCFLFITVYL
jgi:hypothetical protein